MMKKLNLILTVSVFVLSMPLLVGCQAAQDEPKSAVESPTPTSTSAPLVEVAELPYEEVELEKIPPVKLPLAPEEFTYSDDGYSMSAPKVNLPELKSWFKELEADGWVISKESELSELYSVQLAKGDELIFVDAILSEDQPFTSILIASDAK